MKKIFESVKNSAYEIIARKHATYYGIAMAVVRICAAIVRNEQSILPVSSLMTGQYGLDDVVLSIPAVVDANGIETVVPIELSESELRELKKSAEVLKGIIKRERIKKTTRRRKNTMIRFECDYAEGMHPAILDALIKTNEEQTPRLWCRYTL